MCIGLFWGTGLKPGPGCLLSWGGSGLWCHLWVSPIQAWSPGHLPFPMWALVLPSGASTEILRQCPASRASSSVENRPSWTLSLLSWGSWCSPLAPLTPPFCPCGPRARGFPAGPSQRELSSQGARSSVNVTSWAGSSYIFKSSPCPHLLRTHFCHFWTHPWLHPVAAFGPRYPQQQRSVSEWCRLATPSVCLVTQPRRGGRGTLV